MSAGLALAEPSLSGQTGYIHAPSAKVEKDGTWTLGLSYDLPYVSTYNNVSVLPFAEVGLKFNQVRGVRAFGGVNDESYKDQQFDLKLRLTEEIGMLPAVAVGIQDYFGTRLFASEYIVATKTFGNAEVSVGYAPDKLTVRQGNNTNVTTDQNRMNGLFWGARWRLNDSLALVAEKNPIDYSRHPFLTDTHVDQDRKSSYAVGAEYRWHWLGAQVSRQGSQWALNGYVQIPLWQKDFIPKIDEPLPYQTIVPRPTLAMWEDDERYRQTMLYALQKQGFVNVRLHLDTQNVLHVALGNKRISNMSRAVGRAVRTVALLAPITTREIRVTYTEAGLPFVTYEFISLDALNKYFSGRITRKALAEVVNIRYARPEDAAAAGPEMGEVTAGIDEEKESPIYVVDNETGNLLSVRSTDSEHAFSFIPFKLSTFNKSASGYYQYQLYSSLRYSRNFGEGWSGAGGLTLRLSDNFRPFNDDPRYTSRINIVRSDAYDYVNGQKVRLSELYLNRSVQLGERLYGRVTGGLLEDMYGGVEGQLLYFPETKPWALDLTVDAVKKRDPDTTFGFRDYKTLTALLGAHYRLPLGYEVSGHFGRFLAKDWGARFEAIRRFNVGFEAGVWYAMTNADDFNAPGSVGKRYHDKGVFIRIPFNSLLTKDTRSVGMFSWQEWGRDGGQMINSPIDLYQTMRKSWIDRRTRDGLVQFADVEDDYDLPSLGTSLLERNMWSLAAADFANGGEVLRDSSTWLKMGLGLGVVGISSLADKSGETFAKKYGGKAIINGAAQVGNAVPLLALGAAGLASLDSTNPRLASTGMAALQAGGVGVLSALGAKYATGRARPEEKVGAGEFNPFSKNNGDSSFFSVHTAAAWGAVTPFAKEYDAPWLYGVAALTNFGRVAKNKHWVSDTVAGALMGYWLGDTFWRWRRSELLRNSELVLGPGGIGLSMPLQ